MGALLKTVGLMFRRPFVFVVVGIMVLLYCIVDYLFPVFNFFMMANSLGGGGDIFESAVYMVKWVVKLAITPMNIAYIAVSLIVFSFILGFVLSGILNIVNSALASKKRVPHEFMAGVRKYFKRMWFVSLIGLMFTVLIVIVALVASVPSLLVTKAAFDGKQGLGITAYLVGFITIGALFFVVMFFRIYFLFWYAAAVNCESKTFVIGKRTADAHFWALAGRFVVLDGLFIAFHYLALGMGGTAVGFIAKWTFYTFYFIFVIVYVMTLFRVYRNRDAAKKGEVLE